MSSVGHLTTEAIAAYVDGELRLGAHMRASAHLGSCPQCAAEVEAQRRTRADLQRCGEPAMPDSLLGSLRLIPQLSALPADSPADSSDVESSRDKPRWRWPF